MRAVRLVAAGRLEVVEVPDPEPRAGEILVRVSSCGICGSDLSCYKHGIFAGSILGHELAGIVEALGGGVNGFRTGDPVAVRPADSCGDCADCLAGAVHRCTQALTGGHGATLPGGFAERLAVRASLAYPLPPEVPATHGCLAEPLAVAIHGVGRAGDVAGADTAVVGLGPIGLLAVAVLRDAGAGRIVGIDPVERRRELAESLGADRALAPGAEAREAAAGSAVVVEATGRPELLQETTDLATPGGQVILLGVPMAPATVVPMAWVTREITVTGAVGIAPEDFTASIAMLARRPEIAGIITSRVCLADVPTAFASLLDGAGDGKIVYDPDR